MEYKFFCGLYDSDGNPYEESLLVFIGDDTIIKFKDSNELEEFANRILKSLPEIRESKK
jgi:hypothetical protein